MNNPPSERRKAFRPPFLSLSLLIGCRLKIGSAGYCGILRDMSLTGLFMRLDDPTRAPEIDSECEIVITLQGKHSKLTIDRLMGKVIREDEDGVAVHFDAPMEWFPVVSSFLFAQILE